MKRVFNLLVVDESGSMEIIRKQALVGINETLETIRKIHKAHSELEQRVTLITFDSTHKKLFYDNVLADDARSLSMRDYRPCGGTPLYDAIGMGIAKINAQAAEGDNVLVTIVTDGEENCSEEYSLRMIKNLIEKLKKQGWTFTFIGTDNLDVETMGLIWALTITSLSRRMRKVRRRCLPAKTSRAYVIALVWRREWKCRKATTLIRKRSNESYAN